MTGEEQGAPPVWSQPERAVNLISTQRPLESPPRRRRAAPRRRRPARRGPAALGAAEEAPSRTTPTPTTRRPTRSTTSIPTTTSRCGTRSRLPPAQQPPAPRPKRRRKTKAAPVEPVLSEHELGRRAKIKRNNKFLVSVGLLFPGRGARGAPRAAAPHAIDATRVHTSRGWFLFCFEARVAEEASRTTSTPGGT